MGKVKLANTSNINIPCSPKINIGRHKNATISTFGEQKSFLGILLGGSIMIKKGYKGRCEKRTIGKCKDICRTYSDIQYAYADILQSDESIKEIRCNVPLNNLPDGAYTSDFVCTKTNEDIMVRECVQRKFLTKPLTVKLLDASKSYWLKHGVTDWGLVIDAEK